MGVRGVGIVNGGLEEVVVESREEMVGLDLSGEVVGIERKGASVLTDLLYRLE